MRPKKEFIVSVLCLIRNWNWPRSFWTPLLRRHEPHRHEPHRQSWTRYYVLSMELKEGPKWFWQTRRRGLQQWQIEQFFTIEENLKKGFPFVKFLVNFTKYKNIFSAEIEIQSLLFTHKDPCISNIKKRQLHLTVSVLNYCLHCRAI